MKIKRPRLMVETTASSSNPPWDFLPNDILRTIFKNLWVGDRVRSRLVCKHWKQVLIQDYIPQMPEAPWQILSNDSYKNPEYIMTEIRFRSLSERRVYCFHLPPLIIGNQLGGWLCGSSRGWLLIVVGPKLNADMFLWQPLSGEIRKLPPLSTLPFFNEYIELNTMGRLKNLSSVVHRVEIFSMDSTECVVAVIFRRNICDEIALCTPQEKTWKVFGDGQFKLRCSDILYHSTCKELCALFTSISPQDELGNFLSNNNCEIVLTDCRVPVGQIFTPLNGQDITQAQFHEGLQFASRQNRVAHLVESSLTQKFLVVLVLLDCVASENNVDNRPIAQFRCQQTAEFSIRSLDNEKKDERILNNIMEETIFLGAAGSFSTRTVEGVEADCIYFATDDANGLAFHDDANKHYVVREHGEYSLKHKKMQQRTFTTVRYRSGSRVGWFMPRLL